MEGYCTIRKKNRKNRVIVYLKVHQMSKLMTLSQVNVDRKAKCTTVAIQTNERIRIQKTKTVNEVIRRVMIKVPSDLPSPSQRPSLIIVFN